LPGLGLNIAFNSLFLVNVRGYSLNDAGSILALGSAVGLTGVIFIPLISDGIGRRPAAIAVALGITLSPVIGGVLADHYGLVVPVALAAVCLLLAAVALLRVPETAPRVLTRRGLVTQPTQVAQA